LFVNNIVLHCQEKNKCKVRDSKVRNNRFCQCIAIWSNVLRFKILYVNESLPFSTPYHIRNDVQFYVYCLGTLNFWTAYPIFHVHINATLY